MTTDGSIFFNSRDHRLGLLRLAVAGGLLFAAFAALSATDSLPSAEGLQDWGEGLGTAGAVLYVPFFAMANFVIPWPVLAGGAGLLFGVALGTPVAIAGVTLAAATQLLFARHVAGEGLRGRIAERAPRLQPFVERHGLLAVMYARIVPGLPWGPANYAAGLSPLPLTALVAGTLVGGSPKVFAYVALGGSFGDFSAPEAKIALGLLVAMGILGLVLVGRRLRSRPT